MRPATTRPATRRSVGRPTRRWTRWSATGRATRSRSGQRGAGDDRRAAGAAQDPWPSRRRRVCMLTIGINLRTGFEPDRPLYDQIEQSAELARYAAGLGTYHMLRVPHRWLASPP